MDDVAVNFENSDEMIGFSQGHSTCRYDNAGMDSRLMDKNLSVTESNGPVENALEVLSHSHPIHYLSTLNLSAAAVALIISMNYIWFYKELPGVQHS